MPKNATQPKKEVPGKKGPSKKKGGAGANDDDSVDSRGNIRGLIVDSEDEIDDSEDESFQTDDETPSDSSHLTPEQRTAIRRYARKAAVAAREKISKKFAPKKPVKSLAKKTKKVESEDEEEEEEKPAPKSKSKKKPVIEESEEEEEEEEEDEEDEEDEEEEDDRPGITLTIGSFGEEEDDRMIPKRHNMKKESDIVKKFVKLVTEPVNDGGIDDQIDEFKRLSVEKQAELINVLERKTTTEQQSLMFKILSMKMPPETQAMVLSKYNSLQTMDPGAGEYFKHRAWLEKMTSLPLGIYKEIPVKVGDGPDTCGVFMERARKCLGEAIYGQEEAKLQVLQFIASKIANPDARGMSLLLTGPPGIGKTSLIKNGIAKALNWPFQFISLGGDSDASTYTGHQLVYEGSHCGKIVNSLISAKSMSMILMFDEIDKISTTAKGEEIQNLLVHLTDPVQNGEFEDKYLTGVPLDLSKVMFTFSANNLEKIDRVLLDRMVVLQLQGYSKADKIAIAENFLLPTALKEVHLDEKVGVSREVLEYILEEYAKEEKGVRELKRCMEQITQKVNMLRMFNTKELPFHIPNFQLPFVLKKNHIDLFLKKKESVDASIAHLYT
jgi:ATP-dependent Lon protease